MLVYFIFKKVKRNKNNYKMNPPAATAIPALGKNNSLSNGLIMPNIGIKNATDVLYTDDKKITFLNEFGDSGLETFPSPIRDKNLNLLVKNPYRLKTTKKYVKPPVVKEEIKPIVKEEIKPIVQEEPLTKGEKEDRGYFFTGDEILDAIVNGKEKVEATDQKWIITEVSKPQPIKKPVSKPQPIKKQVLKPPPIKKPVLKPPPIKNEDNFKLPPVESLFNPEEMITSISEGVKKNSELLSKYNEINELYGKLIKELTHYKAALEYIKIRGDDIICTDRKFKSVWFYNDKKTLWLNGNEGTLINDVSEIMPGKFREVLKVIDEYFESIGGESMIKFLFEKQRKNDSQEALLSELLEAKSLLINCKKLILKLETVTFVRGMCEYIIQKQYDESFLDKLDGKKDEIAVLNNEIVSLRDGTSRKRTKNDLCSFCCPINYDPNVNSEKISKFLCDVTLENKELEFFLQRTLGLCLTGETCLHQMYVWYGEMGANGKSSFVDFMKGILGDYYVQVSRECFIDNQDARSGSASPHLAELRGKRMAVYCETKITDKLNEGQIKAMTGGDIMKARGLYSSPIEFTPHFKPFILTNHQPQCSTDPALWRRLIMVPFNCKFVDVNPNEPLKSHERIKDYNFRDDVLGSKNEMSALFNWLIKGAIAHYKEPKIIIPKIITDTTLSYKEVQDIYSLFIEQELEAGDDYRIKSNDMYQIFKQWFIENNPGNRIPSNKVFGREISLKIPSKTKTKGCIVYNGYKEKIVTCDMTMTQQLIK